MTKINFTLSHSSLIVSNTVESLKFYCNVIGLQQTERPDLGFPGAWLQLGAQQIHLLELENPDPTTGRPVHGGRDRHIALSVEDLTPIKDTLDRTGTVYTLSISGRKALFCRDPDGNALEILQQP